MRILSRFEYEGRTCYNLDDEGFLMIASERGLYEEGVISGLSDSGYKFCNYHGEIYTPDGLRIQELPLVPCTASVNELVNMIDAEENFCLPESAATKYFIRNYKISEIEMKQPKEIRIHTREELISYINRERRKPKSLRNVAPLNSFVAKEALFTIEEVISDKYAREMLRAIEDLRTLDGIKTVRVLANFLKEEGVLENDYTMIDFVKAYLSWGICGINARITNVYVKEDIFTNIDSLNDDCDMSNAFAGMLGERCIFDKAGNIYSRFNSVNWSEEEDISKAIIRPVSSDAKGYFKELRNSKNWTSKYKVLDALAQKKAPRLYIELIADNGVRLTAKFDPAMFAIVTVDKVMYYGKFLSIATLNGDVLPIDQVGDEEAYMVYNLCSYYAADVIKKKKVKVPVKSTYQMLKQEGVYAMSAVRYIAGRIAADSEVNGIGEGSGDFMQMAELYRSGPDAPMLSLFNPDDLPYDNMSELVDIMSSTRDALLEEGRYPFLNKNGDGDSGVQVDGMCRRLANPVEQFELAEGILHGNMVFDSMRVGRRMDNELNVVSLTKLLVSLVQKELEGQEISYSAVQGVLHDITRKNLLDLDEVVPVMRGEYYGYLEDRAALRANMALTASRYIWVTRVFRECSNQEAEEQRHYMFECIDYRLDKGKAEVIARNALVDAFKEAIEKQVRIDQRLKDILLTEAPAFAVRLLFKIILKQADYVSLLKDFIFTESMNLGAGETQDLKIVVEKSKINNLFTENYLGDDYRKYCTLHDYHWFETNGNGDFNFYCVNAGISPWYVVPKLGAGIMSYNFAVNYFKGSTLLSSLPESVINRIKQGEQKVVTIDGSEVSHDFLDGDGTYPMPIKYDINNVNSVLAIEIDELIPNYKERWIMYRDYAKKQGSTLIRIPLKSDVVYKNYAEEEDGASGEYMYSDGFSGVKNSYWLTKTDKLVISDKMEGSRLIPEGNTYKRFDMQDYGFEDIERWKDLVCDTFIPNAICVSRGPSVSITTENATVTIDLRSITKREMGVLVEKGIAYQLNATKYLVFAENVYEVEVL